MYATKKRFNAVPVRKLFKQEKGKLSLRSSKLRTRIIERRSFTDDNPRERASESSLSANLRRPITCVRSRRSIPSHRKATTLIRDTPATATSLIRIISLCVLGIKREKKKWKENKWKKVPRMRMADKRLIEFALLDHHCNRHGNSIIFDDSLSVIILPLLFFSIFNIDLVNATNES